MFSFFSHARLSYEQKQKIKHWWLTIAFVGGFALDAITLGRVDQGFAFLSLSGHVLNAGVSLAVLYAATAGRFPEGFRTLALRFAPLLVQFSFGSLLSGTLVFYAQSGSWSVSWPFFALVLAVMIGNEAVRDRTQQLLFNLAIFYLGIFSYCILFIPVVFERMGVWVFLVSGGAALLAIGMYVKVLRFIIPHFIELHLRGIVFSLGMIFCTLNFLYFMNIIPPIPLSLKHIDIYHRVEKAADGYELTYEKAPWWKFWREADTTFRREGGEPVYCFASVFAPTAFSLNILHHWEYYDAAQGGWVTQGKIPYHIEGGSDTGYRGYSYLQNTHDGSWRCTVETERGQALGRESFTIKTEKLEGELVTRKE